MALNELDELYDGEQNITTPNGSIINSATGNLVGVISGSQADIGTGGTSTQPLAGSPSLFNLPTAPSIPTVPNINPPSTNVASSVASGISSTIRKVGNGAARLFLGFDIEDLILIVLGVVLIGAAVFSFKTTQTVITLAGKAAKAAGETAA